MKHVFTILLTILFTLNHSPLTSQKQGQELVDSLLTQLTKSKDDTNKVRLISKLSKEYYQIDPDAGIEYGKKGLELAKKLNWEEGIADLYVSLGTDYLGKSEYPIALDYFLKAKTGYEKINRDNKIAEVLTSIGIIYYFQSDFENALKYYNDALKKNELINNKKQIARILGNIGVIYADQKIFDKGIDYYRKGLKIAEEVGDKNRMSTIVGNMAIIYFSKKDYSKAMNHYLKALAINEEIGNRFVMGTNYGNIGDLLLAVSSDPNLKYFAEQNEMISESRSKNIEKSIEYILKAISHFEAVGDLDYKSTYLNFVANAYKQKGDYKNQAIYLEKFIMVKDSAFNREKSEEIGRLETKYEYEKKQREEEIAAMKKAEEISYRNNIQYSGISIFVVLLFITLFLIPKFNISITFIDGLVFVSFLLLFEFILVFAEPWVDDWTDQIPIYKLGINFVIALLFIPFHRIEKKLYFY